MQTTKKYYHALLLTLIILISSFLFVGCSCDFWFTDDEAHITAPVVGLDRKNKQLEWYNTEETDIFDIYLNNKIIDTINISNDIIYYDYSPYVTSNDIYSFSVVAKSNNSNYKDSYSSNIVTINNTLAFLNDSESEYTFIKGNTLTNITFSNNILSWEENANADKYLLRIFTNSTGYVEIVLEENAFDLTNSAYTFISSHQIIVCSVCTLKGNSKEATIITNTLEYNPDGSHMIIKFDGFVWDYYINSIDELNAIVYYNFVSRNTDYTITISKDFANKLNEESSSNNIVKIVNDKIDSAFNMFYETCYYRSKKYKNSYSAVVDEANLVFNVAVDYYGITQCDLSATPNVKYSQGTASLLYYETYDFETNGSRSPEYNNFISDTYLLTQVVSNSDQLVAAVENKITPICVKNSRAELIYSEAKNVLREIISDNMSDYEKALSIFDWITYQTTYDYYSLEYDDNYAFTKDCCYYLEGVFLKNLAVCDGFSKAYSLLCNMEGIDCIRIVGEARSDNSQGGHAWNKVELNDEYYIVDITWTELISNSEEKLAHRYFLVSEDDIGYSHFAYETRTKFTMYTTRLNPTLSYYTSKNLSYIDKSGNKIETNQYIDSGEDLVNALNTPMYTNNTYIELAFDYNYLIDLKAKYQADSISIALQTEMKAVKFSSQLVSQLFDTSYNMYNFMRYADNKFAVICLIDTGFIINEDNELNTLIEEFGSYANINSKALDYKIKVGIDEEFIMTKFNLTNTFNKNWTALESYVNQYLSTLTDINCTYTLTNNKTYEEIYLNQNKTPNKIYYFTLQITSPSVTKIDTPSVELVDNSILQWNSIANATSYSIYANNILIKEVNSTNSIIMQVDISNIITNANSYNIYVVANTDLQGFKDSEKSNVVNYIVLATLSIVLEDNVIYWTGIDNATSYQITDINNSVLVSDIPLNEHNVYSYELINANLATGNYKIKVVAMLEKNNQIITSSSSNVVDYSFN